MENPSKLVLALCIACIGFVGRAQNCDALPDDRKSLKILEKIEASDDANEVDALYQSLFDVNDEFLGLEQAYLDFLANEFLDRNPAFKNKIPRFEKGCLALAETCALSDNSLYFLLELFYAQGRYQELRVFFSQKNFSNDSLNLKKKETLKAAEIWTEILGTEPVNKKRLAEVSSENSEYLPFVTIDGRYMYFTRKVVEKSLGSITSTEKEYFMRAERNNQWQNSTVYRMPKPFNYGLANYGGFASNLQGDKLYITICEALENGYRNCDIFSSTERVNDSGKVAYTDFENLGEAINSDSTWESQPTLGPDGNTLYFARFPGEIGGIDIYYSQKKDGMWSMAKPIEGAVNTIYNEKAPFVHADGWHLYFSSDQDFSLGGYDLYFAINDGGNWKTVKNLSRAINTKSDEHGIQLDADGRTAYVSSNEGSRDGSFDIYQFELPPQFRAEYRKVLSGKVNIEDADSVEINISNARGENLAKLKPQKSNGRFAALLKEEQVKGDLVLSASNQGNEPLFQAAVINSESNTSIDFDLKRIQEKNKKGFTLENVLFGTDDAVVNEKSKGVLRAFAAFMKEQRFQKLLVIGHTDNQGDADYNSELSEKRATAVADLLIRYGLAPEKIESIGKGNTEPAFENATEQGRSKNRRTEVQIIQ